MANLRNVGLQLNVDEIKGLSIHRFLIKGLQDLYWVEKYLISFMTDITGAISSDELKKTIQDHLDQTRVHIMRLEKAFEVLKEEPKSTKSEALNNILKQAVDIISDTKDESDMRDAALIMVAHKIKHYEITAYSSPLEVSKLMGLQDIALLLNANLEEEKLAVEKLSRLVESSLNQIVNPCRKCVTQNDLPNKK